MLSAGRAMDRVCDKKRRSENDQYLKVKTDKEIK